MLFIMGGGNASHAQGIACLGMPNGCVASLLGFAAPVTASLNVCIHKCVVLPCTIFEQKKIYIQLVYLVLVGNHG